ncbi:DUF2637 domain-containing protein [Streptacidiphilus sp. MAP5-52]|uniref:DUF2637 domain-containing protein n=1 Tax=Streptacidiphilus sp. MAP5-52 TaxID=3156267 RepID=UPI003517F009
MPDTATSATGPAERTGRHRATWWDQAAIILLGLAGCALSYDALRQMATAVHVRPQLTYLFPVVIDGFIAYGVRALLVLREAPRPARLYAWALFIAATAASIWANGLHALDLNQPGTAALHLDDTTVTILSAIAPLALAGATHLHILITRYGNTGPVRTALTRTAAEVPDQRPSRTEPLAQRSTHQPPLTGTDPSPETGVIRDEDLAAPLADTAAACGAPSDSHQGERQDEHNDTSQDAEEGFVPRAQAQDGRPPMATLERLADVIAAAHPDPDQITRDSARKALTESGLGAGTHRVTEAIALVRSAARTREHPARPEVRQLLADLA